MTDSNVPTATLNTAATEASGEDEQQSIQVTIPPEIQRGTFANQTLISNTTEEFVLDFVFASPPAATIVSRVILSPAHTKRLVAALHKNVQEYEKTYGKIRMALPTPATNNSDSNAKPKDQTLN